MAYARLDEVPSLRDMEKILDRADGELRREVMQEAGSAAFTDYHSANRLGDVPSEQDLDKILRESEKRSPDRKEYTHVEGGGELYDNHQLLEYAVEKEKHRRKDWYREEASPEPRTRTLQYIATAGTALTAGLLTLGWQPAYLAAAGTYAFTEASMRLGEHHENTVSDQQKENAIALKMMDGEI